MFGPGSSESLIHASSLTRQNMNWKLFGFCYCLKGLRPVLARNRAKYRTRRRKRAGQENLLAASPAGEQAEITPPSRAEITVLPRDDARGCIFSPRLQLARLECQHNGFRVADSTQAHFLIVRFSPFPSLIWHILGPARSSRPVRKFRVLLQPVKTLRANCSIAILGWPGPARLTSLPFC